MFVAFDHVYRLVLVLYAGIPAFCKHLNRFTVDYCQIPAATCNSNKY